jgi:succinate-semialdehyde dehydrogenase/glutarate-semialdehyde dehydrogenase
MPLVTLASTETLFIGGTWSAAADNTTFPVCDPATGEEIGRAANATASDAQAAVEAASHAFSTWSELPAVTRAEYLKRISYALIEPTTLDQLARLLTRENGKPLAEARAEIMGAAQFFEWNAEEARRTYGRVIPPQAPGRRVLTIKRPVGVVVAITAWNFPVNLVARKLAPALAAGCTIVTKPAEQTPLSVVMLHKIMEQASLPAGVANLLTTTHASEVGDVLLTSPIVRKVTFTGSTAVGKKLMAAASQTVKRVSLELGGHAPFLIFEDADLDQAINALTISKFRNAGQVCLATNRAYVARSQAERFAESVAKRAATLRMGPGSEEETEIGPLIDERAMQKAKAHVEDAVARGARVVVGGGRALEERLSKGFYFQPTVLLDVAPESRVLHEETFAPVLPIISFEDEEEAIRLANSTPYGLAAYAFTRDLGRAFRLTERLEFGIIGINDPLPFGPHIPLGGVKESGLGKENGVEGIEEFLEVRSVSFGIS